MSYSTFFGGDNGESIWAIAISPVDNSIYLAGQTFSTIVSNGPPTLRFATTNAFSTNYNGTGALMLGDAFVAHLDSTGMNLLYCTYLGGNGDDAAYAIAVDQAGHAFVAGSTDSTNFPVANALTYGTYNGTNLTGSVVPLRTFRPLDAFVTELETNGSALIYSTYLGGSSWDEAYGIAIDPTGDAFVAGRTFSSNLPVTAAAVLKHLASTNNFYYNGNAFVAEIAAGGKTLNYCTYLGGTNSDLASAIAYKNGQVFVAGTTASTNFPWTNGLVACTNLNGFTNATGGYDAFVSMFSTVGTNLMLQYSTFLGSSNDDVATGITADNLGNAYVVGYTTSTNFPNSANGVALNSYVVTNASGFVFATNAFLTKIAWDGAKASIAFSRVFGDLGIDVANGVALDANGNVFVVGSASSTNFPVTRAADFGSLKSTNTGLSDVVVTAFKADFSGLLYSAYIGGSQDDFGQAIAVDTNGNAWVTGQTLSTNFPVLGTWSTNVPVEHNIMVGTNDAFLTKIVTSGAGDPMLGARHSGTNVLVFWAPVGDVTVTNLGLETATNLLMRNVFTNFTYVTNYTYKTNGLVITTNINSIIPTAHPGTNQIFTTNWVVLTNPVPVLTNGNYIYTFMPTNPMRFFRFNNN